MLKHRIHGHVAFYRFCCSPPEHGEGKHGTGWWCKVPRDYGAVFEYFSSVGRCHNRNQENSKNCHQHQKEPKWSQCLRFLESHFQGLEEFGGQKISERSKTSSGNQKWCENKDSDFLNMVLCVTLALHEAMKSCKDFFELLVPFASEWWRSSLTCWP